MAQPQVFWYGENNQDEISLWDLGTVDAGTNSHEQYENQDGDTFLIWNNRGNADTELSKMEECVVTTKNRDGQDGGENFELVSNTWIQVKVDSLSETAFTSIGGTTTKAIEANGTTTNTDGTDITSGTGEIMGATNDGTTANSGANFAKATFRANIPATASAGQVDFLLRVAYEYV